MGPKQTILEILQRTDHVVSGETLSDQLGVSRVSVWKHIKGMIQSGIPIASGPKGYRLVPDPDGLHAYLFDMRKDRIHFFDETGSTMDEAMRLARDGAPAFSVAVAQRQTKGRGRMQRTWCSNDGGLFFTIVLRPDIPVMRSGLVSLAAAVDMTLSLNGLYAIDARVKWPNDILVGDKKICGILAQMEAEGEQVVHLNIGMGLNVNNHPQSDEPHAVALHTLLGHSVPRREILIAFLDAFERRMTSFDGAAVISQWKACNTTLGRRVAVATVKQSIQGRAVDIDSHGGLVVHLDDGTVETVVHGDCFHQ